MTIQQFFDTWNGKPCDFDGVYGNQCMDLVEQYNRDVYGAPFIAPGKNAVDAFTDYPKDTYDRVTNTPTGVPQMGDIMIWSTGVGPFGHIAVFKEGDTNHFTSFDQNWPLGSLCHFQSHDYTHVLGWLHPKNTAVPPAGNTDLQECLRQHDMLVAEADKLHQTIENLNQQTATLNGQLAAASTTIAQLQPLADQLPGLQAKNTELVKLQAQAEADKTGAAIARDQAIKALATAQANDYTRLSPSTLFNAFLQSLIRK